MRTVKDWPVTLRVTEEDGHTEAELVVDTGEWTFDCSGLARRNPADPDVAKIGDGLAAGRALVVLGNRLITLAELDVDAREPGSARPIDAREPGSARPT